MIRFKKLWALALCAALLLVSLPLPPTAAAAEETALIIGTTGGERGESVTLDVSINEVNGVAAGGFNLLYDSTLLELEKAEPGEALPVLGTINPAYADGMIRVSFAGVQPLTQAGSLLKVTFRIRESAPLGQIPITAEKVKLMGVDSAVISNAWEAGSVEVQSIAMGLSSDNCLPGQAVKLALTLDGPLAPCGGEFELHYNSRLLSAGSIKAEEKLGDVGINFSYRIDEENAVIKASWAAANPVRELGQLCTVIFGVDEHAAGDTTVSIENVKFFNEEGRHMDFSQPTDGVVTVVSQYNAKPILYVVGGILHEDGRTATVRIAVDGAGIVCGGGFRLRYDAAACRLDDIRAGKGCVATNPETASATAGDLRVSWAEDSPALDNETILELDFTLTGSDPVDLELTEVSMMDNVGADMEEVLVHSGRVGVTSMLQDPIAEPIQTEDTMGVSAMLYDAQFCTDQVTTGTTVMLATYVDGMMQTVALPEGTITFDHNGIAQVTAEVPFDGAVDEMSLFLLDAQGRMTPMCGAVCMPVQ